MLTRKIKKKKRKCLFSHFSFSSYRTVDENRNFQDLIMEVLELDSLYLSKRILVDTDEYKDFVSGGVLVSNIDGTIKRIFTSQEEINSWMFRSTGADVNFFFF